MVLDISLNKSTNSVGESFFSIGSKADPKDRFMPSYHSRSKQLKSK